MRASEQFQLRNIHFQQQAFHRDRPHLSRNRRYVGLSTANNLREGGTTICGGIGARTREQVAI